jgi:hypothetical protein
MDPSMKSLVIDADDKHADTYNADD